VSCLITSGHRSGEVLLVIAKSKQETVYGILRTRIEQSQYVPSQRLVIDSLARELGISQVPIREAIRRLEAEGLVLYSANSGPTVAPASRAQWFELMEVLAVLEGYATATAAVYIGANEIKALRKVNGALKSALDDLDLASWTDKNREFHQLIHSRCPNQALVDEIARTIQRSDTISRVAFARERGVIIHILGIKTGQATIQKHAQIIDALAANAPAARIERLTRQHVLDPVRQVKRSLASSKGPAEFDSLA
jgi:DNA-binding GntR family transcriptional regulator